MKALAFINGVVPALTLYGATLAAQSVIPTSAGDPAAELRRRLRSLVTAQEQFWVDHGTYTTDVSALGMFQRPSPGELRDSIWIQVLFAGGRSWMGRAVHLGDRGKSCVIYVGLVRDFPSPPITDGQAVRAEKEGEPMCDRF